MHIFCDESGGSASAERHFTLTAAVVDPVAAGRAVRSFRKVAKWQGEVKGTDLNPEQRALFINFLLKEGSIRGAAVICGRGQPLADWALGMFRHNEPTLYRHLLVETITTLGVDPAVRGITADQSRYKKVIGDRIAAEVTADLEKLIGRRLRFDYGVSSSSPGLQVADVLCNTAGQLGSHLEQAAEAALAPLRTAGLLVTQQANLSSIAPAWLRAGFGETELAS